MQEEDQYDVVSAGVSEDQEEWALRRWSDKLPRPYHMIGDIAGRYWMVLFLTLAVNFFLATSNGGEPCFYGANC